MKRTRTYAVVAILLACASVLSIKVFDRRAPESDPAARYPQPTAMTGLEHRDRAGERGDFKEKRQEYLDSLHRAAPDVDWRAMDRESHRLLSEQRIVERRAMIDRGFDPNDRMAERTVDLSKANKSLAGVWSEKGSGNLAGRMHVASVYDDVIYAGSSGGIVWRGNADGTGWTSLNDWLRMPNIVAVELLPDGVGGHRILVHNGGPTPILYSDDDGTTWNPAPGLEGQASWGSPKRTDVMGDAGQTVFSLAHEWDYTEWHEAVGFYRSANRGASFQRLQLLNESPIHADLWCSSDAAGFGYLVRKNTVYFFDTTGTLTPIATVPATHAEADVRRTLLRGRTGPSGSDLYVAYSLGNGTTGVYSALAGSASFSYAGSVPQTAFRENSFGVSEDRNGELYFGGVDTYRSTNYGVTWTLVNYWWEYYNDVANKLHADVPGITTFGLLGQEQALICTDGGLYLSSDGLATVQNISLDGLHISQYYDVYTHQLNPEVVYAGSQDQGFQRSFGDVSGLIDFEQVISGDYAHLVSTDGGISLWSVYPGFAMLYPDAANSDNMYTWDFTTSGQFWLPPLMEDPLDPDVCWLGGGSTYGGSHLIRLTWTGSSITMTEFPHDFSAGGGERISALAYSPVDTDLRYVMTEDGNFHYSSDAGANWTISSAFTGPGAHYFHGASIVASPIDPTMVWIGGSGYSNPPVYVSFDAGETFDPLDAGLPSTLVYMLAVNDAADLLFAATELGPYVCDLDTGVWENAGGVYAPDQVYWCVEWVESAKTARFGTYGRGIWDFAVQTGTAVSPETPQANSFALQAYPNPFNPRSMVRFEMAEEGYVELDLYDVRGARVAEIFHGNLGAGVQEKALRADRLSSGVYLVRVSSGGRSEEIRVTLVR